MKTAKRVDGLNAPFVTTHWSMVAACAQQGRQVGTEATEAALAELCQDYWPPLYSFIRRRGYDPEEARDLTQGFFAELLESRAYASTDPAKGKFRSFLLALLKHYLSGEYTYENRQKRSGGKSFVFLDDQVASVEAKHVRELRVQPPLDEERLFERNWASALVRRAMEQLDGEYATRKQAHVFAALKPLITGGVRLPTQDAIATDLKMPIETLRSHLSRMRLRYREALRAEVARTVVDPREVEEELSYLYRVLAAGA